MTESLALPDKAIHYQRNGIHIFVNPHLGGKFVTDDTGARILELMKREKDEERLSELIARELHISPYESAARFIAFTEQLKAHRMFGGGPEDGEDISRPRIGFLEITRKCDTRCRLCYVSSGEEMPDTLEIGEIRTTIDQMADMGVEFIALSGGDPLTRGDMLDILAYISRTHGLTAGISTSLLTLGEQTAREMKDLGVLVQISLDGSSPEVNDWNRGPGSFENTMSGVKLLRKYGIPFRFAVVINKHNVEDVNGMVELGIELGAEEVAFGKVRVAGRAEQQRESPCPGIEEMAAAYHRLYRKDVETRQSGLKIRCKHNQGLLTGLQERVGCLPCGAGRTFIQVSYNGDIVPCSLLSGLREFRLGNVRKDELGKVWEESAAYEFFRKTSVEDIGICRDCEFKYLCGGGCRADAYLNGGDLYALCDDCKDLQYYYRWILNRGCNEKHVTAF